MNIRTFLIRYAYVYCYVLCGILVSTALLRHGIQQVSSEQSLQTTTRILIDAGHGGIDGGTTSVSGILEKELNLQISRRLERLLALLGHSAAMTRTSDQSLADPSGTIREQKRSDLRNRVSFADASPNTILVSIHQNHFPDSRYRGPQVFHTRDPYAMALAQALQQSLNDALGTHRTCRPAEGVYLMEHISVPGILVECGFLSNPAEDQALQTPEHQKNLCCLIASQLTQFISQGAA